MQTYTVLCSDRIPTKGRGLSPDSGLSEPDTNDAFYSSPASSFSSPRFQVGCTIMQFDVAASSCGMHFKIWFVPRRKHNPSLQENTNSRLLECIHSNKEKGANINVALVLLGHTGKYLARGSTNLQTVALKLRDESEQKPNSAYQKRNSLRTKKHRKSDSVTPDDFTSLCLTMCDAIIKKLALSLRTDWSWLSTAETCSRNIWSKKVLTYSDIFILNRVVHIVTTVL